MESSSPIQGPPAFQNMNQVNPVSAEMVAIAKMALGETPAVPQSSPEEITSRLLAGSGSLKKISNDKLSEIGGNIPENANGIMGAVVISIASTREKVTSDVAGSERAVFDEAHVIFPEKADEVSNIAQKTIHKADNK
jgi:hypothetical protein